jgi:hypothetical protein
MAQKTKSQYFYNIGILKVLFFSFDVGSLFFAPFTKLLELNFALNFTAVFTAPVVNSFTGFAGQLD